MSKAQIGTRVPFEEGERVYDRLTHAGPFLVASDDGGTLVRVYTGKNAGANYADYYGFALTRRRPRRWWLLWLA